MQSASKALYRHTVGGLKGALILQSVCKMVLYYLPSIWYIVKYSLARNKLIYRITVGME